MYKTEYLGVCCSVSELIMSLRLTPITPGTVTPGTDLGLIPVPEPHSKSHPDSDFSPFLGGHAPSQYLSGKQISTLFPFVKPSVLETSCSVPQSTWIVQKTLQTTWHLYRVPIAIPPAASGIPSLTVSTSTVSTSTVPTSTVPPSYGQPSAFPAPLGMADLSQSFIAQSFTVQSLQSRQLLQGVTPLTQPQASDISRQSDRSWGQYLRHLLVFSCGAAVSTLLYTDPIGSLKGLFMGPSLATVSVPTPDGTAFIETAQRQLYHLDRLVAQQNQAIGQKVDLALVSASPDRFVGTPPVAVQNSPIYTAPPESPIVNSPPPAEDFEALSSPDLPPSAAPSDLPEPLASSPLGHGSSLPIPPEIPNVIPGVLSDQGRGELLGVLEQGDQSMALFKVNGTIERVAVGEQLANGARFTGTQDGKALLQLGESQVPLAVGQSF
jgi:hypothetical protein